MIMSHLSQQEVWGGGTYHMTTRALSDGRQQLESQHWMFLRTPGDIEKNNYFSQEVGPSASLSLATMMGISNLARMLYYA